MKKSLLCFCLMLVFAIFHAMPVAACWAAPKPFEIFSEDGGKVFVFTPDADSAASAEAAVYEIADSERRLVYAVEDLSSFAYEANFFFSSDMNHFARMFNGYGLEIFEVFSNGIRTRTVLRSDIIDDYASEIGFTSIGPMYAVNWRIEYFSPGEAMLTISTGEGNTFLFDLTNARFTTESAPYEHYEAPPNPLSVPPVPPESLTEPPVIEPLAGLPPESHQESVSLTLVWIVLISLMAGACVIAIVLLQRRK